MTDPKWLGNTNKTRMKRSIKHETRLAKDLGGKRLAQSGGKLWSKQAGETKTEGGDLTTAEFLFEHKRTEKGSLSVKREWLGKVREGARSKMKEPGLILTFERGREPPDDWILIPKAVFEKLMKNQGK